MPASRVQGTLLQRDVQKLFGITITARPTTQRRRLVVCHQTFHIRLRFPLEIPRASSALLVKSRERQGQRLRLPSPAGCFSLGNNPLGQLETGRGQRTPHEKQRREHAI